MNIKLHSEHYAKAANFSLHTEEKKFQDRSPCRTRALGQILWFFFFLPDYSPQRDSRTFPHSNSLVGKTPPKAPNRRCSQTQSRPADGSTDDTAAGRCTRSSLRRNPGRMCNRDDSPSNRIGGKRQVEVVEWRSPATAWLVLSDSLRQSVDALAVSVYLRQEFFAPILLMDFSLAKYSSVATKKISTNLQRTQQTQNVSQIKLEEEFDTALSTKCSYDKIAYLRANYTDWVAVYTLCRWQQKCELLLVCDFL